MTKILEPKECLRKIIDGKIQREGYKLPRTVLDHFEDIKDLEVADGPAITVKDILPYKCERVEKALKALELIKKHFIIEFDNLLERDGTPWGLLVSFQAKEDEGDYDTTACANLVDHEEEFNLLKEVLSNERN